MSPLTHRLRLHVARRDALRALRVACVQADGAYARWAAEPTRDHYRDYLAADAAALQARQALYRCDGARHPEGGGHRARPGRRR